MINTLIVGADASKSGRFVAVVMGEKIDVSRFHKKVCGELGLEGIHMRRIIDKLRVVRTLDDRATSDRPSTTFALG